MLAETDTSKPSTTQAKDSGARAKTWLVWTPEFNSQGDLAFGVTLWSQGAEIPSEKRPAVGSTVHVYLGSWAASVATVTGHTARGFEVRFHSPQHPTFTRFVKTILEDKQFQNKFQQAVDQASFRLLFSVERQIWKTEDGPVAVFDQTKLPFTSTLERSWPVIRREFDELARTRMLPNLHDVSGYMEALTNDDQWQAFILISFGKDVTENCNRCPETARVLRSLPGLTGAMFSIMAPGKHVTPHRGPYKGILRAHLGVKIPKPENSCRIRIGSEMYTWQEGKVLAFDDTFEHEVWNDSNEPRIVLFMDFARPLSPPLSWVNSCMLGMFARSPWARDSTERAEKDSKRLK